MFVVLTSSLLNGPVVNFSASFTATGSYDSGIGVWNWGVGSQEVLGINNLTLVSQSISGSSIEGIVQSTLNFASFDINNECNNILTQYISGSNINTLFSSKGVTLG